MTSKNGDSRFCCSWTINSSGKQLKGFALIQSYSNYISLASNKILMKISITIKGVGVGDTADLFFQFTFKSFNSAVSVVKLFNRPGMTLRPQQSWPLLPMVLALVPLQKFPTDFTVFQCKCPLQNEMALHSLG